MALSKEDYQERTVVENGKVVTYGIPHGRTQPEIISMTPLSDEKFIVDAEKKAKQAREKAVEEEAEKKEKAAKQTQDALIAENEKISKEKAAASKK